MTAGAKTSGGGPGAARDGKPGPGIADDTRQTDALCDHPNCSQPGLYHAPRSRERLQERYQFCLEHVRIYNRSWDYCRGMSRTEIERMIQDTAVWERRTWPVGFDGSARLSAAARQHVHAFRLDDSDGEFSPRHPARSPPLSLEIREALGTYGSKLARYPARSQSTVQKIGKKNFIPTESGLTKATPSG